MSGSVVGVLLVVGVAVVVWWPGGGVAEAEERERAFCWKVGARVSAGEGDGSVSACAERLERVGERDRAALRTEVRLYGRHVGEDRDGMPVPVRRGLARALGEWPGLVYASLASDGGGKRPYLGREELAGTVRAVAGDAVALRELRASQEAYARERIASLTRGDFEAGEKSVRAVEVVRSVGRATGALTALARSGRPGDTRAERVESYERHGFPRVQGRLEERARTVGVPQSDIQDLASPFTDLRSIAESAYLRADRGVDGQGTEGEGS